MNARKWMMVLTIALMGIGAQAQQGQTTMEGVPIVDEIVADKTTTESNDSLVSVQNTTKVGSWHVTTYLADSIDTTEIIEFTEETFDDLPEIIKGLFGFTIASGGILIAIIALLCVFGLPLIIVLALLFLIFRRRKSDSTINQPSETPSVSDRALFNKGIKNVCLGVGLAVMLGIIMGDFGIGIGILIICIGIGELLVDHFAKK
jgi:ABC-type phosphate transport system permease subunit